MNNEVNTSGQEFELNGTVGELIDLLSRYPRGTKVGFSGPSDGDYLGAKLVEARSLPAEDTYPGRLQDDPAGELTLFLC